MARWDKSKYQVKSKYEEKIGKNIWINRHTKLVYKAGSNKPIGRFVPANVVRRK